MSFWEYFGYLLWGVLIVSYLLALLHVLRDLFRSSLSGWMKAVWVLLLIVVPLVSLLIWLIVGGFADKTAEDARYAGSPASDGSRSATEQIADAQAMRDAGQISTDEFLRLKGIALK